MNERTIFMAALDIDVPAQRAAWLDEACRGDSDLRKRVEALIQSHEQAVSFLNSPPPGIEPTEIRPADDAAGAVIGPYKLLQKIGEGGMGVVYMAEQTEPVERRVALKIIKPGMDTRQVIARFEAERQALAMMDHPNIAKVLDAGATGEGQASRVKGQDTLDPPPLTLGPLPGRPFFVMELVKGLPITQYCDEQHLTPRERLELFLPICQAVQHAHQKGVIHRDLKPSNILVARYDDKAVPKIIDFGVAKAVSQRLTERTMFTQYGQIVGTIEYMSPEQAQFNQLDVDTRSDIYSLGVLLYELLTGETPFDKQRLRTAAFDELLRIIREEEPPRPSTRLSSSETLPSIAANRKMEPKKLSTLVRGELDWIVMKCLEKDRSRRYETANGLMMDVQRYLSDEPVLACPPSAGYRLRKFARRNKAALATGALVSAALVAAVVVLAVSNMLVTRERNAKGQALAEKVQALADKQTALNEKQAALTQSQANFAEAKRQQQIATDQTALAKRRLYASQMNLAMQAWHNQEVPRVLELLEGQRPKTGEDDLRGFEWFYLWRLCSGGRRHLRGHTDAVLSLSYSPDGRTLASAGWDGTVRLWDTASGRERLSLRHSSPSFVACSPDGKFLAAGGLASKEVIVWDASTGKQLHSLQGPVDSLVFTTDSRKLLGGQPARLWDVESGALLAEFSEPGMMVGMLPDRRTVVTVADQYLETAEVRIWDAETGARRLTIPLPEMVTAALSPDGSRIATSARWTVTLWETSTGKKLSAFHAQSRVRGLSFSPDGTKLAAAQENRRIVVWNVESGQQLGEDVHRDVVWGIAFSPDGKTIASSTLAGDIKLWDMDRADESVAIPVRDVERLSFSAGGKTLYFGAGYAAGIIDVAAGREVALLPFSGVGAFSAGGTTAAHLALDNHATVWDVNSGRELASFPVPASNGRPGITLSSDGTRAATFFSWRGDTTVRLWDIATRQAQPLLNHATTGVNCAAFSPDGKLLALGFQFQLVVVWNLATSKVLLEFHQSPAMVEILTTLFSPDSRALAVGTHIGTVTMWDVETGRQLTEFRGHTEHVQALAFSPDGTTLATGGNDRTVKLWDARTGQERSTLTGHTYPISDLQFSPDGTVLASASRADGIRLWAAATDAAALAPRVVDVARDGERSSVGIVESVTLPPSAIELTESGLREAVRSRPDLASAHLALGQSLREQKRLSEALVHLREAARLEPDNHLARNALGWTLVDLDQFAEAEREFRDLMRLKPDARGAHFGLGLSLKGQQNFAEAVQPLREAIRLDPARDAVHHALGLVLIGLQQFPEAEAEFREQVRLQPDKFAGHFGLGRALMKQQRLSEAEVELREAIRLDPTVDYVHRGLGWLRLKQQQPVEAEAAFREGVRLKPAVADGHFGLAQALVEQEKFADAEGALREVLRLEPAHPGAAGLLNQSLVRQGKPPEPERANKVESETRREETQQPEPE